MAVAIGEAASGVFSTSDTLWADLEKAGHYTGDRMWRFPLWNYYSSLLKGNLMNLMKTISIGHNYYTKLFN
jgi:aminopeptidase